MSLCVLFQLHFCQSIDYQNLTKSLSHFYLAKQQKIQLKIISLRQIYRRIYAKN